MTDKQIIIDDLKEMIYKLQIECVEKTDNILSLGKQLKSKEQECEGLKIQIKEHNDDMFKNPPEKRFYCKGCTLPYISKKQSQTLTEIKVIANFDCTCGHTQMCICNVCDKIDEILQKISECEVK